MKKIFYRVRLSDDCYLWRAEIKNSNYNPYLTSRFDGYYTEYKNVKEIIHDIKTFLYLDDTIQPKFAKMSIKEKLELITIEKITEEIEDIKLTDNYINLLEKED